MRLFLIIVASISFLNPCAAIAQNAANADNPPQVLQPEQEAERLRTLFQEIVAQTEARLQKQAESLAASKDEAARLSGELATAQQEITRLTTALEEAEAAGTEVGRVQAEATARIDQQAQDLSSRLI